MHETSKKVENNYKNNIWQQGYYKSMAYCKTALTAVTPLRIHWSYYSVALSHRNDVTESNQTLTQHHAGKN